MLNSTPEEKRIRKILDDELNITSVLSNNTVVVNQIVDFFKRWSVKPIAVLFSKGTVDDIIKDINNSIIKSDLIEFIYRMKSSVNVNKEIYRDIYNIVNTDSILDALLTDEIVKLEVGKPEDLEKYFILVLIYIYKNVAPNQINIKG